MLHQRAHGASLSTPSSSSAESANSSFKTSNRLVPNSSLDPGFTSASTSLPPSDAIFSRGNNAVKISSSASSASIGGTTAIRKRGRKGANGANVNKNNNVNALFLVAAPILVLLLTASSVLLMIKVWSSLPNYESLENSMDYWNRVHRLQPNVKKASFSIGGTSPRHRGFIPTQPFKRLKKRFRPSPQKYDNVGGDPSIEYLRKGLQEDVVPYDLIPRALEASPNFYGVVHQLPSIPDRRRMIPSDKSFRGSTNIVGRGNIRGNTNVSEKASFHVPIDAVHNLTYFLESRMRADEEDRPLFIYNPMLVPLDERYVHDSILSGLHLSSSPSTTSDLRSNNELSPMTPKYVGVYRVSNFGNCHGPGRGVPETYRNYLGLALLDRDLNIAQDDTSGAFLDVVIDLNEDLGNAGWMRRGTQSMQDCQLILTRETSVLGKNNKLILLCNEYAMPVSLRRQENSYDGSSEKKQNEVLFFRNKYGSGLQLSADGRPITIVKGGKNMHFFVAGDARNGPGYLEVWPGGPHEVIPTDFGTYPFAIPAKTGTIQASADPEPNASYETPDTKYIGPQNQLIGRDSGSACCVRIRWKQTNKDDAEERNLLLGFSHRKTRRGIGKEKMYNYLSRVYAFEPLPPFNIVARSGYFCFGFSLFGGDASGNLEARQSDNEQVWGAANDYKLQIHNQEFDCPRIHFVTGIAEKVDDEETVIVSYGVNDCYPRMIEVPKKFFVNMLRS